MTMEYRYCFRSPLPSPGTTEVMGRILTHAGRRSSERPAGVGEYLVTQVGPEVPRPAGRCADRLVVGGHRPRHPLRVVQVTERDHLGLRRQDVLGVAVAPARPGVVEVIDEAV